MRLSAITAHPALRGSRWRLALVTLLALTAVLAGLFTMHSMAGASGHNESANAAPLEAATPDGHAVGASPHEHVAVGVSMAPGIGATESHREATLAVSCDEACQMGCLMVGFMCTLALLAVLMPFFLPRLLSASAMTRDTLRPLLRQALAALAPPRPPSLIALSISRT